MRKVSFTLLLLGIVLTPAGAMTPLYAQTSGAPAPAPAPGTPPAAPDLLHPLHQLAKHPKPKEDKPVAAAPQPAPPPNGLQNLMNALRPPIPPMPPSAIAQANPQIPDPKPMNPDKPVADAAHPAAPPAAAAKPKPPAAPALPHEVQQFCANTVNAAADARVVWEAARLTELEAKLRQRIAEFEMKRAEYEDWLHKHDDAMKQAKEDVVSIYSRMRPDAAAAQLAVMDDVMAASVLTKLNSRNASAILAEMDPGRAARIANAMVGPIAAPNGKKS